MKGMNGKTLSRVNKVHTVIRYRRIVHMGYSFLGLASTNIGFSIFFNFGIHLPLS